MPATNWTDSQVLNQLVSGYSWSGSTITFAFPTTTSGLTGSTEKTGFTPLNAAQTSKALTALSLWDDLMQADLVQTTSSTSNIEFGNSQNGVSYAQAYFPTAGTVWFNPSYSDLSNPVIGRHGFLAIVHEIGHALGLDHMGDYNGSGDWTPSSFQDSTVLSVMSYFGPSWGSGAANGEGLVAWADWVSASGSLYSPQTPMLNDVMAIQSVYGVETTTRTDDTTYGFNSTVGTASGGIYDFMSNANPILCLFDSGGNDTLDLSGWSTSSIISLVSGSFSSSNSMTYNISIAYTCNIENAVGGAGNDTLTGSAFANRLDGGNGNDTFTGGMGDDVLIGGGGTDTAVFVGAYALYTILYDAISATFTVSGSSDGTDILTGIENFLFSDQSVLASSLTSSPPPPGDAAVAVSIAATTSSANEGNSGSTAFSFTVTLAQAATSSQSVNYTVLGTGADAASSADFSSPLTGTVTFDTGQTVATIQVLVSGDTVVEKNETFSVTLSSASSGLQIGTASATSTIVNDDVSYKIINGNNSGNTLRGSSGGDAISGLGGNDTIYGNNGNDLINGGRGNDKMTGGAGSDTFRFTDLHFGKDRILDYVDGTDLLSFSPSVEDNFADFTITGNGSSQVTVWHGVDSIVISGASPITLTEADFLFV